MMPATQCMAVCSFVLFAPAEPMAAGISVCRQYQPALAAMPAEWSMPPETAPPRL
jgi:hypothetical protein